MNVSPSSFQRSAAIPLAPPGSDNPDRSPFMSAAKTGTPASESCSVMPWRPFVFPVPVAPAISPCLFVIRSGTWTTAVDATLPSSIPLPSSSVLPCAL